MKKYFLLLLFLTIISCEDDETFVTSSPSKPPPRDRIQDPIQIDPCRIIISKNLTLTQDIDCTSSNRNVSVYLLGDQITINGNNHSLKVSESANIAVYAQGKSITIKNLKIDGFIHQQGIVAHNVKNLTIDKVIASGQMEGIVYSADNEFNCQKINVKNSILSQNSINALRVTAPHCANVKVLKNNDFSFAGDFALNINSKNFTLTGADENSFLMSQNGIKIKVSQSANIRNLNLAQFEIPSEEIYIEKSNKVELNSLIFGGGFEGTSLHAYDAKELMIKNSIFKPEYIGIKVANESYSSKLTIKNSEFKNHDLMSILLSNFGSIPFDSIIIKNNLFLDNVLPLVDYSQSDFKDIDISE